jgi:hypothetical protein
MTGHFDATRDLPVAVSHVALDTADRTSPNADLRMGSDDGEHFAHYGPCNQLRLDNCVLGIAPSICVSVAGSNESSKIRSEGDSAASVSNFTSRDRASSGLSAAILSFARVGFFKREGNYKKKSTSCKKQNIARIRKID